MEVDERINRLEEELNQLKANVSRTSEDLKSAVEDLKNAVIDIRSAVSELENPFNLLRVITSEEELEKLRKARASLKGRGEAEAEAPATLEKPPEEPLKGEDEVAEKLKAPPPAPKLAPPFGRVDLGLSLLRWVFTLLDIGFDGADIRNISSYCEGVGFLPEGSTERLSDIVEVASKARSIGLKEDAFLLIVISAAKASGLDVEVKELDDLMLNLLRELRYLRSMTKASGE